MDPQIAHVARTLITARDRAREQGNELQQLPVTRGWLRGRADGLDLAISALAGLALFGTREDFEAAALTPPTCSECGHGNEYGDHTEGCEVCNVRAEHGEYAPCAYVIRSLPVASSWSESDRRTIDEAMDLQPMGGWEPRS